jgi:uncharacterized membrane protein
LVAPIVVTALAYFHVISAMGWLGGDLLLLSAIGPGLRSLTSTASLEFTSKVAPGMTRFFIVTSTATIIFGLGLLASLPDLLGTRLYIGIILGLLAYLATIAAAVFFRRSEYLAGKMLASVQAPPSSQKFAEALSIGRIALVTTDITLGSHVDFHDCDRVPVLVRQ